MKMRLIGPSNDLNLCHFRCRCLIGLRLGNWFGSFESNRKAFGFVCSIIAKLILTRTISCGSLKNYDTGARLSFAAATGDDCVAQRTRAQHSSAVDVGVSSSAQSESIVSSLAQPKHTHQPKRHAFALCVCRSFRTSDSLALFEHTNSV